MALRLAGLPRSKPLECEFDRSPPETSPTSPWHLDEHVFLINMIAEPLAELRPFLDRPQRAFARASATALTVFAGNAGVSGSSELRNSFVLLFGPKHLNIDYMCGNRCSIDCFYS
ncbi:hypothetical protein RHECNPAF_337002 [Rhizobium etli CNPAF512]|nr:hypothetical protein RHECNPAF_337002 [Rhizobium etli CNPAF512]